MKKWIFQPGNDGAWLPGIHYDRAPSEVWIGIWLDSRSEGDGLVSFNDRGPDTGRRRVPLLVAVCALLDAGVPPIPEEVMQEFLTATDNMTTIEFN